MKRKRNQLLVEYKPSMLQGVTILMQSPSFEREYPSQKRQEERSGRISANNQSYIETR